MKSLGTDDKTKEQGEEENRGGHCQKMSQMSKGRRRRIKMLYVLNSILQCPEIHCEPLRAHSAGCGYLNAHGTKAPAPVCCSHLNAQYTHVEAQNYSPTHYIHIL